MVSNREFMRYLSKLLACILIFGAPAIGQQRGAKPKPATGASVLPLEFAGWHMDASTISLKPTPVLKEYGLTSFEHNIYHRGERQITITAYTFPDATGAYGFFTYNRTPSMAPEKFCGQGASDGNHVIFHCTNVFVDVQLDKVTAMTPAELRELASAVPRVGGNLAELPKLPLHLSEKAQKDAKYVAGPAGLDALNERVNSSLVDFSLGPEVVVAHEAIPDGIASVILVQYPTPKIAQLQVQRMIDWARANKPRASNGATATDAPDALADRFATRRSGPLVGIVTGNITEGDARRILEDINYDAEVTWSEPTPTPKDNVANLLVNIIYLSFIIGGFMLVMGVAFGGFRLMMKKYFPGKVVDRPEDIEFIKLNLRQ